MSKRINNHLKKHYSNYNLSFLKKYYPELNLTNKILDVGTGHYRNLKFFHELGFKNLYGIDKNIPEPIFKDKNFKVRFLQHNIEEGLPYETKSFDVVLCNYVLMFIASQKQQYVVNELLRVTKKFLIIETNKMKKETKNTEYQSYSFNSFFEWIEENKEFEVLQKRKYYEKLLIRRI